MFTSLAKASGIEVLRTSFRAVRANAVCQRFLGSVRRECLDHMLIVTESQLYRVIGEYVGFYNTAQPNQGIGQRIPGQLGLSLEEKREGKIIAFSALNGLHTDCRRVA